MPAIRTPASSYFGLPIRDSLATTVHPNEFLDGAFTMYATRCLAYFPVTWDWQNHPLLLGLYREHRRKRSIFSVSSSNASPSIPFTARK